MLQICSLNCRSDQVPKKHRSMLFAMHFAVAISFGQCFAAMPFEEAKVLGTHLAAVDVLSKLKSSKCGYIFKKTIPTLDSKILETQHLLKGNDLLDFNSYVLSSEFKAKMLKNQDFIDGSLQNFRKDGMDAKTACGLLIGSFTPISIKAESDWRTLNAERKSSATVPDRELIEPDFLIRADGILDTRNNLLFSKCPYGMISSATGCSGEAILVTVAEAFNERTTIKLKPWRVPTGEELNSLFKYFLPKSNSPFPKGAKFLTASAAKGSAYLVIHYGSFTAIQSGRSSSDQTDSNSVPQSQLLLVRAAK